MEAKIRAAVNRKLMEAGVTLVDPATAYISEQAEIAPDCVIGPDVQIIGKCRLGEGVRIDGTAWLSNVTIGPRCHLKLGVRAEDCVIGEDSEIGPFANLRAGTELAGHNRIGNFVETKKARLGRGTKASHLSYLGDATIGADTNVGCGVITVNYDGYEKHQTVIGDRCMVGCDTQLVAPGQSRQRRLRRVRNNNNSRGSRRRAGDVPSSPTRKTRMDGDLAHTSWRQSRRLLKRKKDH